MINPELDEGGKYIGYREAITLIMTNTIPNKTESLPIASCTGYVSTEDVIALVNSPTDDVSLKDGFAIKALNAADVSNEHPVTLKIIGSVFAGGRFTGQLKDGQAVKICSGSPVPTGAEAVISAEFCDEKEFEVQIKAEAGIGRNIFHTGEDIQAGSLVLEKGKVLLPARLGLIAAAGVNHLKIYPRPKIALIAIGDEVIAPGQKLGKGQLYASNLITIGGWLSCFNTPYESSITIDNSNSIKAELLKSFSTADVIVTCGGAWESERDLIVKVLDELGWRMLFRHVRIGPGKGIAFGIWKNKPIFCLPGGPPSNEMAFLQLALPGILHLAGLSGSPLCTISAELTQNVNSRHPAWTEFKKARLTRNAEGKYFVTPHYETSRLKSMADSACLICKPEDIEFLYRGQIIPVQVMVPAFSGISITDMI